MTDELLRHVQAELAQPAPPEVAAFGARLGEARGASAVLFYGSALRTGDLDGVLDFYLLTRGPHRRGLRGFAERWFWPEVSYHELDLGGRRLRAKAATMSLETFREAAAGRRLDTTIWARFVQPSALIWAADEATRTAVAAAVAGAAVTAARYAAVLGPAGGAAAEYWTALFRETYAAEFRVERPGREGSIMAFDAARYDRLLPMGWVAGDLAFREQDGRLEPLPSAAERARVRRAWRLRRALGKPLNIARLMKASFTFEGAARYAAWKIERHTGVAIDVSPFRERHPILSAPGVLWRLWRSRRSRAPQAEAR